MAADHTWADLIESREMTIKRKTTHCLTCGKKLAKTRPDYFISYCCTACKLADQRKGE